MRLTHLLSAALGLLFCQMSLPIPATKVGQRAPFDLRLVEETGDAFGQLPPLRIDTSGRFLVRSDSKPFVWIGDTNWFFAGLPPATIDSLLQTRKRQGFTIMQVSCREKLYNGEGPGKPGRYNEAWWAYLDEYLDKCEKLGLYVGLNLGWWSVARQYSKQELFDYGRWVGNRYRNRTNIVWMTLGEAGGHLRKSALPEGHVEALVRGIRAGDTGGKLLTVHADFKRGTSLSNHGELSDFNNWQTSQWCCLDDLPRKDERHWTVWEAIAHDYALRYGGRPKPTLDSEAWYERNKDFCGAEAYHMRRRAYFTIFAGGFGHTYGAGGIWDALTTPEECSAAALEAMHYPGATAMTHLSDFLHALGEDFLKMRPHQDFITSENPSDYDRHLQAALAVDGSFGLVYSASDDPYSVNPSGLDAAADHMLWYDPRNHSFPAGTLQPLSAAAGRIDPPGKQGAQHDWVLLIGNKAWLRSIREGTQK